MGLYNDELYHWGIKGQKWGVRRYQNKDGTYTKAGKKRYAKSYETEAREMSDQELRSKIDRMNLEKRYVNLTTNRNSRTSRALDTASKVTNIGSNAGKMANDSYKLKDQKNPRADLTGKTLDATRKSVNTAKKVNDMVETKKAAKKAKKKLENMTDKDLRDTVNRMDLERQYSQLKRESVSRGRAEVREILDIASDIVTVGASITTIAVGIHNLKKGIGK